MTPSEIEREHLEMRKWPDRERDEIRAIYRAKGFAGKLLDDIVAHITSDPKRWSDVMMREELGFSGDFESPLRSEDPPPAAAPARPPVSTGSPVGGPGSPALSSPQEAPPSESDEPV